MGVCCNERIRTLDNEFLNKKLNKALCKIQYNNVFYGIGFFCKIPFPNFSNILTVLITNNNILGGNRIMKGKNITISLNNDNPKNILIDESRLIYTNKELYDITIIEIKKMMDLN